MPSRSVPHRTPPLLCAALVAACAAHERSEVQDPAPRELAAVEANDNRARAGRLSDGVLTLELVARRARWSPEAQDGPAAEVVAFGEAGGPPQVPAPLIRVPEGTTLDVTIRNALPDSTLWVWGLATRPAASADSLGVPPGESRTFRFVAGAPGTYLYGATPGRTDPRRSEEEQLAGAFIVDAAGAPVDDRVFVISIWGQEPDSLTYRNVLAINGKSWPHTEPIQAAVGETLRWRVLNASVRNHPMHLHGFYFGVESRGSPWVDTAYAAGAARRVVTEDLSPGSTIRLSWVPERPGNWLFHCHLSFHVVPGARLDPPEAGAHQAHAVDPREHMAGLVLGIRVRGAEPIEDRAGARRLRLLVQEGAPRRGEARALGYVLQRGATSPASDSIEVPGSTLVLTRGEPTDITVVNRLGEATAVHWHGIELESYSDGVAGWSGIDDVVAPPILPGDSFTARLTLPRAGTFIYHTHLNDIEQLTAGLYGAIVVLEPGERFDPRRDHLFVTGWEGEEEPPRILLNGDTAARPVTFDAGVAQRLRFVNIGPAARLIYEIRRDTAFAEWRPLAKDGADLPARAAVAGPAARRLGVGETFDAEFVPLASESYRLIVRVPNPAVPVLYELPIRVR